jgi:hypothetical protein
MAFVFRGADLVFSKKTGSIFLVAHNDVLCHELWLSQIGGCMNTATVVPMTKERAAEIMYNDIIKATTNGGRVPKKNRKWIIADYRGNFPETDLSDQEIIDFAEFTRNEVNQALKKK